MILLFIFTLSGFTRALIVHNDIWPAFPPEERSNIEGAVISGAVHFLKAQSYANLLMTEYEESARRTFDMQAAITHATDAYDQLEKSIENYGEAIVHGRRAGYFAETIKKFKAFNYDSFITDTGMDKGTMSTVRAYFSTGDILGAYQQNVDNINAILLTLSRIKTELESGQLPSKPLIWLLLQQFSKASIFGNYCTVTAQAVFDQ